MRDLKAHSTRRAWHKFFAIFLLIFIAAGISAEASHHHHDELHRNDEHTVLYANCKVCDYIFNQQTGNTDALAPALLLLFLPLFTLNFSAVHPRVVAAFVRGYANKGPPVQVKSPLI